VGTAYVGLFNMVFAHKHGGKFVLRIEDTDQTRSTQESEDAILRSLKWVGLNWDEGPDVGGDYGPYRQSERTEHYQKHAWDLVEKGAAYPCFCTPDILAAMREEQKKNKEDLRYNGRCRALDQQEAIARAKAGETHVIRLKVDREQTTLIPDRLRGEIKYENTQIDDQVLLKSDGFPTYHLANVVDDHLMEITHVIRAEEWIPSTPKHIMLYAAFGWEPPEWIHLPLLRNLDKSKISKRKNPVSLDFFQKAGFLPEALLNFLGMMGWSMPDESEKFTVEQMMEAFTWDRMGLAGPVFNVEKLEWLNGVYIRDMESRALAERIREEMLPLDQLEAIVPLLQERIKRIDEFLPSATYFLTSEVNWTVDELIPKNMDKKTVYRLVKALSLEMDQLVSWTAEPIKESIRAFIEEQEGWKKKDIYMLIRTILTGRAATPPLFETMEVIGKPLCRDRLRRATLLLRP